MFIMHLANHILDQVEAGKSGCLTLVKFTLDRPFKLNGMLVGKNLTSRKLMITTSLITYPSVGWRGKAGCLEKNYIFYDRGKGQYRHKRYPNRF